MDSWACIHKYASFGACSWNRLAGSQYRNYDNSLHEADSRIENAENIPSMIKKININDEIVKGFLSNVWSDIICHLVFLRMGSWIFFFLSGIACWSSEMEFCYLDAILCDLFRTSVLCLLERMLIFFVKSLLFPLFFFSQNFWAAICLKVN